MNTTTMSYSLPIPGGEMIINCVLRGPVATRDDTGSIIHDIIADALDIDLAGASEVPFNPELALTFEAEYLIDGNTIEISYGTIVAIHLDEARAAVIIDHVLALAGDATTTS